ncbi:MAG: hypothetical protein ACLFRP_02670 [Puniceicoccaceae bacterium]
MKPSPPVPDLSVCASLFFRGVLPAFEDFLKCDPVARRILGGAGGDVVFSDRSGRAACLSFGGNACVWSEVPGDKVAAHVRLGSEADVVRFIRGGAALPWLAKGWSRPVLLSRLLRLFLRFRKLLKPDPRSLGDPDFRLLHVRLALAVALFSLAEVGRADPWARRMLEDCPDGTVCFRVGGTDLAAWISKSPSGLVPGRGGPGAGRSDAVVGFASPKVAMEILTRKKDAHAAVALGEIRVDGLIPLADGIDHVLDRVARYLP